MTKFLKPSKVKSDLISETITQKNTYKYHISAKSVRGLGSYEYLKVRPVHGLDVMGYGLSGYDVIIT